MKVAIITSSYSFTLSQKGYKELVKKGWETTTWDYAGEFSELSAFISIHEGVYAFTHKAAHSPEVRTHPDLISMIETLGDEANFTGTTLKIIEVPDDVEWQIENWYGLYEIIREKSRIWY